MIDCSMDKDFTQYLGLEENIIAKVAWHYFHENLTQQQIADLMGISRMKIIKILERAKTSGVIQFRFRSDVPNTLKTEECLMGKFNLQDCFIVPAAEYTVNSDDNIGRAGAAYLINHIESDIFLNVSYGKTTSAFLQYLGKICEHNLTLVSMTGGVNHYVPAHLFATYNFNTYLIPAPLFFSSKEVADSMKQEKEVQEVMNLIPLSSATIVGIGSLEPNTTLLTSGIVSENELLFLKRSGAVCDLLGHFIDADGNIVSEDFESRTLSTDLNVLKTLKNVVCLAGGANKVEAIRAALKGGYINVLVTDETTAQALVKD